MLLKSDHITRRRTKVHQRTDGEYHESVQDVQPVMEAAQAMRRHWTSAMDPHGKDGSLVGKIPAIIVDQLVKDGIFWDDEALLEWLERPENRMWKMHPGRFARRKRGVTVS